MRNSSSGLAALFAAFTLGALPIGAQTEAHKPAARTRRHPTAGYRAPAATDVKPRSPAARARRYVTAIRPPYAFMGAVGFPAEWRPARALHNAGMRATGQMRPTPESSAMLPGGGPAGGRVHLRPARASESSRAPVVSNQPAVRPRMHVRRLTSDNGDERPLVIPERARSEKNPYAFMNSVGFPEPYHRSTTPSPTPESRPVGSASKNRKSLRPANSDMD